MLDNGCNMWYNNSIKSKNYAPGHQNLAIVNTFFYQNLRSNYKPLTISLSFWKLILHFFQSLKTLLVIVKLNIFKLQVLPNTANIYLFKVKNRNNRKRCEINSKLTIKTTEDLILVFIFSNLNIFHIFFWCFYCWLGTSKYLLGNYENFITRSSLYKMKALPVQRFIWFHSFYLSYWHYY